MSIDPTVLEDDQVLALLAACDDALMAGQTPASFDDDGGISEIHRADRVLACMKLLREVLATEPREPIAALAGADPATKPSASLPFQQLGRYQIRRSLGEGSCGIVFLAFDPQLRRETALKVPRGAALLTPSLRERFLREARAAAVLNHPNIIAVHEAGEVGPVCYIAAEYCPGVTLSAWLKGCKSPVPARDAAGLMHTLAKAVQHAHERGVLHRDLKPSNIMLQALENCEAKLDDDQRLPWLCPKITDFSLAKFFQEDDVGQTHSGDIVGTPQYMAPEQAAGNGKAAGAAADVYALGAILYELLSGRPPFRGETSLATLQQVLHDEPLPLRRLNANVPRDLEVVCLKCLEKEPHRRYLSAAALAEDLGRFRADRPIVARPSTRLELAWRWCRRNQALAIASGLAVAGLFGIAILASLSAVSLSRSATKLREALRLSEEHRHESELRLAETYLERGRAFGDQESGSAAMLFLAHALKITPPKDAGLNRAIRAHIGSLDASLHRPSLVLDPAGEVGVAALSPDGATIACGRADGAILIWNARSGDRAGELLGHRNKVGALAFSRDGSTLVSGSKDGTARIWNVATCRPIAQPLEHGGEVRTVDLSPDGGTVLTGNADGVARLWQVSTGNPLGDAILQQGSIRGIKFDPEGKVILTFGGGPGARLWDASTRRELGSSLPHLYQVRDASFSADGRLVLTGSEDHTARLWDRNRGEPIGSPLQHTDTVRAVVFSPDGKRMATASADGTARIWDCATTQPTCKPLVHHQAISSVAFRADGLILATGSDDQTARLWDARSGEPIGLPLQHAGQVWQVAFSPDGRLLSWGQDDPVRLWDVGAVMPVETTLSHQHPVSAVAFSPDGSRILTTTFDAATSQGQMQQWDAATHQPFGPAIPQAASILAVTFSPDSKQILSAVGNLDRGLSEVQLWDSATGKPVGRPVRHGRTVTAVAFRPDGKRFLTASQDRTARLWSAATGELILTFPHDDYLTDAAFSPDGTLLLTGSEDRTARLWDAQTAKAVGQPLRHQATVMCVAFSPDGRTALTGSLDHTAQFWDTQTSKPVGNPLRHNAWVAAVAFSPDGRTAVTASADNTVQLWDTSTLRPIAVPFRHQASVIDATFSPDGRMVLSGSADSTARLWSIPVAVDGEVERITLWAQVVTGAELDASDLVRVLDAPAWQKRRLRLYGLGGSPLKPIEDPRNRARFDPVERSGTLR